MEYREISPKNRMVEILLSMVSNEGLNQKSIPSERQLSDQYGVSRTTVRTAISELISRNILISMPGKGNYINLEKLDVNLEALDSTTQKMRESGKKIKTKVLQLNVIEATKTLSRDFSVNIGEKMVELKRIRFMDKEPFSLDTSYLLLRDFPGIEFHDFTDDSLFRVLTDIYKVKLSHGEETFEISYANYDESLYLRIEESVPILILEGKVYDETNRLVEKSKQIIRSDKIKYHFTVNIN